ncbi:MAG TPA: DivIVA domain-containing protein [Gaiellales bacterium]|jgi:DivIVA domain-containing protein
MIDLASIRNASFTLTPTGYNPEEVDRFLADLADQLAEGLAAAPAAAPYEPNPQFDIEPEPQYAIEQPRYEAPAPAPREPADIDGLRETIERTIGAMDAFVANELATLKSATELETDELVRERERLLDEAGAAAQAHLEETRARAESILAEARRDGEAMRARFEGELQVDRDRFEQALADREALAHAQVAEILADAESRRREAEELVTSANRVQTQVLASLENARATLSPAAPTPVVVSEPVYADDAHRFELSDASADAFPAHADEERRYNDANDAAA